MQFTQELLSKLEEAERERDLAELDASEMAAKLQAAQAEVRSPTALPYPQRRECLRHNLVCVWCSWRRCGRR